MMLMYGFFESNVTAPLHNHPHEQLATVIKGEASFTLGSETRSMKPNDAVLIPLDVKHGATAGPNGCVTVEVFSPPREDYQTT